jgi:hypothetical protein
MGLLSGFFERRRNRESAVQPGTELTSEAPPAEEVKPVGQPFESAGQPAGFGLDGAADISSVFGMLGMIKDAYESGNIQISHGSSHMIDLRGDTNVEELREQIITAMEERGIDPAAAPDGTQLDSSQYAGLQDDLLKLLGEHGIDVNGPGAETGMPDTDGDGQPG